MGYQGGTISRLNIKSSGGKEEKWDMESLCRLY